MRADENINENMWEKCVSECERKKEGEKERTQERDEGSNRTSTEFKPIISSHTSAQCFGPFRPIRDVPLSLFI